MSLSQRVVNTDLNRFFFSYIWARESKFKDLEEFREEFLTFLLKNKCFEIKGYTSSCILFTCKKDKDYDFWHKLIYRTFRNEIRFVFGEVGKRTQQYGELEVGRFKSLRLEDKQFAAQFEKRLLRIEMELNKRPVR